MTDTVTYNTVLCTRYIQARRWAGEVWSVKSKLAHGEMYFNLSETFYKVLGLKHENLSATQTSTYNNRKNILTSEKYIYSSFSFWIGLEDVQVKMR